jgi:hypothetical protein
MMVWIEVVFRDESVAAISLAGTALVMTGTWLRSRKEARSPIPPPARTCVKPVSTIRAGAVPARICLCLLCFSRAFMGA